MFIEARAIAIHFVTFLTLILLFCDVNSLMSNEAVIRSKNAPTLIALKRLAVNFLVFHKVRILDKALSTFTALERPFPIVYSIMIKKTGFFLK